MLSRLRERPVEVHFAKPHMQREAVRVELFLMLRRQLKVLSLVLPVQLNGLEELILFRPATLGIG